MSRVLVMWLLRVIGSVGLGLRVVRGAMLVVAGSTEMVCALVAPRSEKIGEHGRRKRRHVDDECT